MATIDERAPIPDPLLLFKLLAMLLLATVVDDWSRLFSRMQWRRRNRAMMTPPMQSRTTTPLRMPRVGVRNELIGRGSVHNDKKIRETLLLHPIVAEYCHVSLVIAGSD